MLGNYHVNQTRIRSVRPFVSVQEFKAVNRFCYYDIRGCQKLMCGLIKIVMPI